MTFSLGIVGAGQFSGQFATLFLAHPGVGDVYVTDLLPERAERLAADVGLTGTFPSYEAMLASEAVDAVAVFTQRWTHGPLVLQGLEAGKHVYSAVPMAITTEEIAAIIDAVRATGLTYMMGETSQYNPATVHARNQIAEGAFGRIFYAEGDYVHDMDLGFYEAYRYSGGENWKETASYPPLLYPTHSVGGVLGAWGTHAVSVSAIGVVDERGTASSTRRSACSATTSPTPPRCSRWRAVVRSAPTSSGGWDTRPTSASPVSASSVPRRAWSSSRRWRCGRTRTG